MPTKISNSSHIRAINGKTKKPGVLSSFRAVLAKPFSRQYRNHTILVAVVALVTAFLTNPLPDSYQVGSVATRTYRSDRPLDIPDPLLTREERQKAVQNVVPIFIMDDNVASDALQTLRSIFRRGRQLILGGAKEFPEGFVVDFSDVFGKDKTSDQVLDLLERVKLEKFSSNLERSVTWLTLELLSQGILDETASLSGYTGTEIEISRAGTGISQASLSSLLTLETARGLVEPRAQLLATDLEEAGGELIEELTLSFLKPNLILDTGTLSAMRKQAELSVPELHHHVAAGEIIVREGETVSPLILLKLQALSKEASSRWLMRTIGILLIFFVFLAVTEAISTMDRREHSKSETVLMTFILLMYVILAWASIGLGRGLNRGFDFIENRTLFLVMPIPAAAMLATIFLGRRRAIFVAFLGSILAAAVAPLDTLEAFIYLCTGSLVSILHLSRISERSRFIPSSIMCALVNALTILGINFTSGTLHLKPLSYEIFAAMGSGLLSGIIASGLVPVIELLMGFTTNFKLMELGNLNRPILRELMVKAPGTYHHSVIVGSMVEAAAEAIGANAHLARVGAYYHDIGKVKKPLYFIENQGAENRHDTLTPTMSVLLLVAHVKDGSEMARENKLPPQIVDIVEQHHGTSLMSFFYHKAMENRGPNSPEINEMDFRYPGPKPQSKEAGLVMLADICEAATRSLAEPTPTKIHELVKTLINRVFDDGQLEASELALKDITEVKRVFVNILVGIYHHRVAYPGINKDSAKEQQNRSQVVYGHITNEPAKRITH